MRSDGMPGAPAAPTPQPLPTYYPSAVALEQAQPITLERGQSVSDIDVVLTEGLPAVIVGTVIGLDGQPVSGNGYVNARGVAREGFGGVDGSGTGLRPDGTFRMTLAPGEWMLEARLNQPPGHGAAAAGRRAVWGVRISAAGGAEETVSIAVGRGATVTGRVVFEGSSPPPPSPTGQAHVPLYSQDGACRSGQAAVAADWTFRVTGTLRSVLSSAHGASSGGGW